MIKVDIRKNIITVSGHAMYDDYGKDIVCASVSSIITTSVNNIIKFDKEAIKYEVSDGYIKITLKKETREILIIIENMIEMLEELQKQYKNNIKIRRCRDA